MLNSVSHYLNMCVITAAPRAEDYLKYIIFFICPFKCELI
jgi:hypothetical protein